MRWGDGGANPGAWPLAPLPTGARQATTNRRVGPPTAEPLGPAPTCGCSGGGWDGGGSGGGDRSGGLQRSEQTPENMRNET